jgi:peptidyl-tRNA hydrolase
MGASGAKKIGDGQGIAQHAESSITTYAVFGSTGNCGTEIIRQLLQMPKVKINAYCRNKNKLIRLIPEVVDNKNVEIFEGSIDDSDLLAHCSKGCRTLFLLASTNDNVPGCRISQDLAHGLVKALQQLRKESIDYVPPRLVLLSSATIDDHLSRKIPYFRPIMLRAASNIYEDLRVTERFLRTHEDWLSTIYIKPGGLSLDVQRGHKLSLDEEETFLSYADLAAGMLEAANDPSDRWNGLNVSVINANGKAKFPPGTPKCIFFGLIRHYMSFLHPYLPATGPA